MTDKTTIAEQMKFYSTFGAFINLYSIVETHFHGILQQIAKLDDESARVLTGGMRLSDVVAAIKRLAKPPRITTEAAQELEPIFVQFSHITKLRDVLVHRGWNYEGDIVTSSNFRTAKSVENIEILRLNHDDLLCAFSDLGRIMLKMGVILNSHPGDREQILRQPWRYKPRPLTQPNQRPQKDSQPQ